MHQKFSQVGGHNSGRNFSNTMRRGWIGGDRDYMRTSSLYQSKREMAKNFSETAQWNTITRYFWATFGRIFSQSEPEILEQKFQSWIKVIAGKLGLKVVAIDGKNLKGSYDRESSLKSLILVSAWSSSYKSTKQNRFVRQDIIVLKNVAFFCSSRASI